MGGIDVRYVIPPVAKGGSGGVGNVVGPGASVNGDVAIFSGITGKLIADSNFTIAQIVAAAVAASGNVVGPVVAVDGNLAVFDGTTGKLLKDGGAIPSGGTPLLGINAYAPGSNTFFSTTSTLLADLDATNMKVTFVAPASGHILVRLTAYADITLSTGQGFWGLREGSNNISGAGGVVCRNIDGNIYSMAIYLTGISAGSHTYKWSSGVSGGLTLRTGAGPGNTAANVSTTQGITPAIMEVWAAS